MNDALVAVTLALAIVVIFLLGVKAGIDMDLAPSEGYRTTQACEIGTC